MRERKAFTRDWRRELSENAFSTNDLFDLSLDVISVQLTNADQLEEEVGLEWLNGHITLEHKESGNKQPYEAIDFEVGQGKRHHEWFSLRKYPEGDVRAFWVRPDRVLSYILGELVDEPGEEIEVPLDPARRRRIAQVLLSAHATTMAESAT